ncbi:NADH dehydrogenase [ubiquinone] 1 alpha subcomplex assembly factor 1, partial [Tremellales sp. Uapishka_1]
MASPLKTYLDRSFRVLKRNTARVIRMDVTPNPPPLTLFSFNSALPPVSSETEFALGSDADIGGLSTCALTPVASSSTSHMAFHGNLSLAVPPAYASRIRTGYAAFRTRTKPTIWGEDTWDLGLYTHLRVVVGYRGWEGWRSRWVLNLQTDGPVRSDLFQHRLSLPQSSAPSSPEPLDPLSPPLPTYTTLHLPLSSFVLTNSGQTSETQIPMMRSQIRTVGFGLLGGGRVDEGLPATSTSSVSGPEAGRIAAGGWGAPSLEDVEGDRELEELIASDSPSTGYHRAGQAVSSREGDDTSVTQGSEGYFELCVRSVQAVRWDPEVDEEPTEDGA